MSLEKTSRCFLIACTGMILILLSAVSCRWPEAQIELDKKRFGRISTERFPGTSCCPDDSASSKRRRSHPLGPTGGWGPNAGIDTSRRHDTAKNEFRLIGGEIAGYIQFPTSGRLAIRSYDDVYGTVYCGWSPAFVEYEPQPQPVYVAFSLCIVGDGGLDQVHELCWIPEGEEKGVIVFSTAHPEQSELKAHELFLPRHIGVIAEQGKRKYFYFNNRVAGEVFDSLLRAGKVEQARKLVSSNLSRLQFLPPVIDGATRKPIPSLQSHCDTWVKLLLLKAGLNLFDASSIESLSKVKTILGNKKAFCFQNPYASDLVDLYEWAASRVQGMRIPVPPVPERANRVHGYDLRVIAGILLDPKLTDATLNTHAFHLGGETNYFWLGLREFLTGNMEEASRYLAQYSSQPNQGMNDFELAATAALQEKMGEKRRVPLP